MSQNQPFGTLFTNQRNDTLEELTEEQEIQVFVKQMLINRLFVGHYKERRFVEKLNSYRDVVVLDSSESDLKKDLDTVIRKLKVFYKTSKVWIGFTGSEDVDTTFGHALWVKLHDLAFGQYWFQIRQVKFLEERELFLRIKYIRPIDSGYKTAYELKPENKEETNEDYSQPIPQLEDIEVKLKKALHKCKISAGEATLNFISLLTLYNIKEAICFISVLIAACVTGIFHSIRYLGDYSIRFMREFSIFIHTATPVFLAVIEFFGKCVGGFYLLIAMLWRGSSVRQMPNTNWRPRPAIMMPPYNQNRYRS